MNTFALALRNLLRNRRRSITTILAMIVGAHAVLLFGGYSRNITYGLQTDYVKYGGHLQIQREGYYLYGSGNPAAYGIAGYDKIIHAIQADPVLAPMLVVATPTLQLQGIAGNFARGVSRTAIAQGVVVEDQNRMRDWNDYAFPVVVAPMALTGTQNDAAIVGTGLARVLSLCSQLGVSDCDGASDAQGKADGAEVDGPALPADVSALAQATHGAAPAATGSRPGIELLAATARGAPNVAALQVVKAEQQGIKEFDDVYVGLHLAQAQRLVYGNESPHVTAIVVQLKHTAQLEAAKARLDALLADQFKGEKMEVVDFVTLNPFYGQALAMFATLFGFVALLIAAIVLFTVGNTMSMAVIERTVEIGTLRALGLCRGGIRKMFVCEGLMLGLLGAVLGVASAAALAGLINHSGMTWTPPGRSPVPLIIRVWGESDLIVGTVVGLLLVAVLSAVLPARRAARMNVADALRHT
ncbi:ABC transporter permease [Cupriavidus consociatus]|uniref:ABC transporter permease n=1 Tax=Cupriavidus consociatus TaxID=2821357 RepID=UPI001AE4A9B6|nr:MULTISPECIES: FtsX-like permease family protein [unclassified Cupriavidus]MBP0624089.1 ABC transporter permease [Cupriavidus sp. LEh25]MDK2660798.1 FtsX-like permease family protein [Cupriavidus sp. LEh21]